MSIGLYDDDFRRYIHVPFNLELMKLAAYYKKHNEIVVLTPSLQTERHTTNFLRKDYDDGHFLKNPSQYPNLTTGGLAYTNGIYVPMEEDIERTIPDTSIYNRVSDLFGTNTDYRNAFKVMSRAEHLRLSLDGKTVWSKYSNQIRSLRTARCLFFHDPNLGEIENAKKVIDSLVKRMNKSVCGQKIASKFPIVVKDEQDLLEWSKYSNTAAFFSLKFNGIINDETFEEFINKTQTKTISDQLIYNISGDASYASDDFLQNGLPQIYKQVIFSRSHKRKIRLYYSDDFFPDTRWERLIQFWQSFLNQASRFPLEFFPKDSLFKFARSIEEQSFLPKDIFKAQEVRELFNFVKEKNYELFKLFYECSLVKLQGGNFVNDTV